MAFEPREEQKELKYEELRLYTDEELNNYTEEELKNFKIKHDIPMLEDLEKGPWPSFVADAKREALHRRKLADGRMMIDRDVVEDLLGQLELSFEHGETHWKHGGIVGVFGYGGGVIGRYSDLPEKYPSIAHTLAETSGLRLLRDRQIGRRGDLDRYYDPGYIAELTHQNEVSVVMGDIHGSTYLTNAIGPELMVAFLDEYLLRMSTIIVQSGGAMDKSLGDSVMGVFGNFPGRHEDSQVTSANSALLAALKMRQAYVLLREEWMQESREFAQTGMGVGVSTGKVKTGTVGPEATMVGPAVNLSSKLSKLAVKGRTESEIYIDSRTRELIGNAFNMEPIDFAYTRKKVGVDLEAYRIVHSR